MILLLNMAGNKYERLISRMFGETYLIAAEAYYIAGDPGTAADRINEVRRRAAKTRVMDAAMEISAGDITIDFILDERAGV